MEKVLDGLKVQMVRKYQKYILKNRDFYYQNTNDLDESLSGNSFVSSNHSVNSTKMSQCLNRSRILGTNDFISERPKVTETQKLRELQAGVKNWVTDYLKMTQLEEYICLRFCMPESFVANMKSTFLKL